jgi:uncharacterized damage-inducible protein DinB
MSILAALIQELDQEAQTTRRVLERVPEDRLSWKPHEKSMSLGQLALHVATVPGMVAEISQHSPFPVPEFTQPGATSAAELVPVLEQSVAKAKQIMSRMKDADLANQWSVVDGSREVMRLPIGALLRSIMLNHWYHHRGQLSVYLRQVGVPVPSIYGPSADENPFAANPASAVSARTYTAASSGRHTRVRAGGKPKLKQSRVRGTGSSLRSTPTSQ